MNRINKKGFSTGEKVAAVVLGVLLLFIVVNLSSGGVGPVKAFFANFIPDKIDISQEQNKDVIKIDEALPLIKYGLVDNSFTFRQNGGWNPYKNEMLNSQISGSFGKWYSSFIDYWYYQRTKEKFILKSGKDAIISNFPEIPLKSKDGKINLRSYVIVNFPAAPEKSLNLWQSTKSLFKKNAGKKYLNNYLISYEGTLYRQKVDAALLFDSYEIVSKPNADEAEIRLKAIEWRESVRSKPINLEIVRNGVSESSYFCTINYGGNSLAVDFSKPVGVDKVCI
ncbi:MAG: hypothetical protein Q7R87_04805 [Nanoarchaeota archaeon]|nr:hypothetical protein [Nanoarchaeota archaeon]